MPLVDPDDPGWQRLVEKYASCDPVERAAYFERWHMRQAALRTANAQLALALTATPNRRTVTPMSKQNPPAREPVDLDDYEDAVDARLVLNGMGHSRQRCKGCKRRTVTRGYVCWNCRLDNSRHTEEG